jgi:hypothetical protein
MSGCNISISWEASPPPPVVDPHQLGRQEPAGEVRSRLAICAAARQALSGEAGCRQGGLIRPPAMDRALRQR